VDAGDEGDPPLRKPGPNSATAPGATGPLAGLNVIDPASAVQEHPSCWAQLNERFKHAHRAQRATLVELSAPSPAPVGAVPDGAGDPPRCYPP